MKKWVRWQGLGAFGAVAALFSVFWLLFVDGFVERLIEHYGTELVGARVELGKADLSLFPAGLELTRLQVTNPDKPMTNIVEIKRLSLSLDALNLLRRKVIVEEMTMDALRLNTKRAKSGAIGPQIAAGGPSRPKSGTGEKTGLTLPSLKLPDAKEILGKEELESLRLAKQLEDEIQTEKEKWQRNLDELPDKETLEQYEDRLNKIKSGSRGLAGILGSAAEIAAIRKELRHDLGSLKAARQDFTKTSASLRKRLDQVAAAPQRDIKRLAKKYSLSAQGLANMSRLLFGARVADLLQTAVNWHGKAQPVLERRKEGKKGREVVKPVRGRGVQVRFREERPLPDFLIRKVLATVQIDAGDFRGTIENITPDQDVLGVPLTFAFGGRELKGIRSVRVNGVLNHITPFLSKDEIHVRLRGYEVQQAVISDDKNLPVTLDHGKIDLTGSTVFQGQNIAADLRTVLQSARLAVDIPKDGNTLTRAIATALSEVNKFAITAKVNGTVDDYRLKLTSDLDRILKRAAANAVRQQTAILENKLKQEVMAKVDEPLAKAKNSLVGFDGLAAELTNRLNLGSDLLSGVVSSF